MMTDWRDEFDRAIIDRNKAVRDAIEWKARAEAAEKRVAELEAAQAWRPVTEPPEDINIEYWTYDRGDIDKMEWTGEHWMMNCTYWYPSHWRPLPPPPTGNNS